MPTIVVVQSSDSYRAANLPGAASKLHDGDVFTAETSMNVNDIGVTQLLNSPRFADLTNPEKQLFREPNCEQAKGWC